MDGAELVHVSVSESLTLLKERHDTLTRLMQDVMQPGVDYGKVEGARKPVLHKSGAELLSSFFSLVPQISSVEFFDSSAETEVEIWSGRGSRRAKRLEIKRGLVAVKATCSLSGTGGKLLAVLSGMCSSLESQYLTQSVHDVRNTVLKMAEKRSFIAAVLAATGASRLFSADMEDSAVIVSEADILADRGPAIALAAADLATAPDADAVAFIWSKIAPDLRGVLAPIRGERLQALGFFSPAAAPVPEPVCVPDLAAVQGEADAELQPLVGEVLSFSAVLATEAPRSVGADSAARSLDLAWGRFAERALFWASKGARVFVHLPRAARPRNLRERYDALAQKVKEAEVV